jgi:RimJ/RimL family protein N-acetyltransferase
MWTWIGDKAVAQGAELLLAYTGEDEPEMLESLARLGYDRARTERVWELSLAEHGERLAKEAAEARARMDAEGIRMLTVAGWNDPDTVVKLYELNESTVQDVPHSVTIVAEQLEDFERRMRAPDRRLDRWWIAVDGDRAVAMSYLKFPPVRGSVWTGYTCTDPAYRGRGIARAVKLQSLAQAIELGIPTVHTDNDSENAPMLHINEALGYVPRPGFVEHHKRVTNRGGSGTGG